MAADRYEWRVYGLMDGLKLAYVPSGATYQAGVCNIGPAEVRRRRRVGIVGLAIAVVMATALVLVGADPAFRILVALPTAGALSGFIQARLQFCANYGWRGVRDAGGPGAPQPVGSADARALDRRRSLQIFGASLLGGLVAAVVFAILPI